MTLPSHLAPGDHDDGFALSGLDALLATAARSSPDTVLAVDDEGGVTAATLARRTRTLAGAFRRAGLRHGERVLVVAGAQVQTLAVIVAAVRGGLEPALARPGLGAVELAAHARAAGAVALIGPATYGAALGEAYLSAAALADGIRLVATHGREPVDGALDLSAPALADADEDGEPTLEMPLIATFDGAAGSPRLVSHRQAALFADALSLVEQARIDPTRPLLSLLPPASRAGLVGGLFAALVGASRLVLHGPFAAAGFLHRLDDEPGAHLVAPIGIGTLLATEPFAGAVSSLVLVSRFAGRDGFVLPPALREGPPVTDLYAFGEETLLAQRRVGSVARAPDRVLEHDLSEGLGARLNRARAEHRLQTGDDP